MVSGDVLKLECGALEFLPAVLLRLPKRSIRLPKAPSLAGLKPEIYILASARLRFSATSPDVRPNVLCSSA